MRYFGTKRVEQIDEDAVAVERLTAIAGRFKTGTTQETAEVSANEEAPEGQAEAN